jgi:hypothetical protein
VGGISSSSFVSRYLDMEDIPSRSLRFWTVMGLGGLRLDTDHMFIEVVVSIKVSTNCWFHLFYTLYPRVVTYYGSIGYTIYCYNCYRMFNGSRK